MRMGAAALRLGVILADRAGFQKPGQAKAQQAQARPRE